MDDFIFTTTFLKPEVGLKSLSVLQVSKRPDIGLLLLAEKIMIALSAQDNSTIALIQILSEPKVY